MLLVLLAMVLIILTAYPAIQIPTWIISFVVQIVVRYNMIWKLGSVQLLVHLAHINKVSIAQRLVYSGIINLDLLVSKAHLLEHIVCILLRSKCIYVILVSKVVKLAQVTSPISVIAALQAITITKTNASLNVRLPFQLWTVSRICALILALLNIIFTIMFVKLLAQLRLTKFLAKMYASQMDVVMDTMLFPDNQDVSLVTLNVHVVRQRVIIAKDVNQITS